MNTWDKCKNCGGQRGIHHYATLQCPVGGRLNPLGRVQEWMGTTFEKDNTNELQEQIKKHLKIAVEHTDRGKVIIALLWDNEEIDSDQVTLE